MNLLPTELSGLIGCHGPISDDDQAHILRSKIIDKCAKAERHVLRLLRAAGGKWPARAPLSQKIEALKTRMAEDPGPVRVTKVAPLLVRLQPLSDLRSELVHSTLSAVDRNGDPIVILTNAADDQLSDLRRVVQSFDQLRSHHKDLSDIANSLEQEADHAEK